MVSTCEICRDGARDGCISDRPRAVVKGLRPCREFRRKIHDIQGHRTEDTGKVCRARNVKLVPVVDRPLWTSRHSEFAV